MTRDHDDDSDLLGDTDRPPAAPIRTRYDPRKGDKMDRRLRDASVEIDSSAFLRPVSRKFLSEVFGIAQATVKAKLSDLDPVAWQRANMPLYNFRQAASRLVERPNRDMADYIKKIGISDLPSSLQKDVWDARLKEQKWKQAAGDLWHTQDVIHVLSAAFSNLKDTTRLWVDNLSEEHDLTTPVRASLERRVDALMAALHTTLVDLPRQQKTPSQLATMEDENE